MYSVRPIRAYLQNIYMYAIRSCLWQPGEEMATRDLSEAGYHARLHKFYLNTATLDSACFHVLGILAGSAFLSVLILVLILK